MELRDPQMDDREEDDENIIMIRMDIKEPLNTIKSILEDQIDDIRDYKFTLQGGEELDGSKNLLDHCVQGEGQVQINLILKFGDTQNTIDIIDVLKPDDEEENSVETSNMDGGSTDNFGGTDSADSQRKGGIQGSLDDSKGMNMTGDENPLKPIPKKRRRKPTAQGPKRTRAKRSVKARQPNLPKLTSKQLNILPVSHVLQMNNPNVSSIQLWQFLLELLTTHDHRTSIQWLEREGEFKLINPERVALLWGLRKNKPNMNYEKLSRALRYYYDGDMISKVPGKRFVYKFICDLKFLIGYTASELNTFVTEAESASGRKPGSFSMDFDFPLPQGSPPPSPKSGEVRQGLVMPSDFSLE